MSHSLESEQKSLLQSFNHYSEIPVVIRKAHWHNEADQAQLQSIRRQVFLEEQGIATEEEWDGKDALASTEHLLVFTTPGDQAIACARLLNKPEQGLQKIGRVAVLASYRGNKVAQHMLEHIIQLAKHHAYQTLELESQCYITSLYEKLGFSICSDIFLDAGIEHVKMQRSIL